GIPRVDQQTDAQPGAACHGIPQVISTPSPSCPGRRGTGDIQKNFPARLDKIAAHEAAGKPIEIWQVAAFATGVPPNIYEFHLPPTLGIPPPSHGFKLDSIKGISRVEPWAFTSD
ncbi:unnamed protein product, partial [Pararhodospirillum photometricum DSM 122]